MFKSVNTMTAFVHPPTVILIHQTTIVSERCAHIGEYDSNAFDLYCQKHCLHFSSNMHKSSWLCFSLACLVCSYILVCLMRLS